MTNTRSGDILIGRKANGEKVYVEARLEHPKGSLWKTTVDHRPTTERLRLSIYGAVISKYGSITRDDSWLACGQTADELAELVQLEPGWTVGDVAKLIQIWKDWHLNDMQAGCIHQTQGSDSPQCPESGYKWGRDWLIKPLTFEVFSWICDHFEIEPPAPGSY